MPRTFKKYKIIHSSSNLTKKNKIINKSDKKNKNKNKNKKITQNKFNLHGGSISIKGDDKKVYKIKKEKMEDFMKGNYELNIGDIVYFIMVDDNYYQNIYNQFNNFKYHKKNMNDNKKKEILNEILNNAKSHINEKINSNDKITLSNKLTISNISNDNYIMRLENMKVKFVRWILKIFLIPVDFITEDNISSLYDDLDNDTSNYIIGDIFTDPTYFFYVEDEPKSPSKETP
jgi:hypothetical protein